MDVRQFYSCCLKLPHVEDGLRYNADQKNISLKELQYYLSLVSLTQFHMSLLACVLIMSLWDSKLSLPNYI